MRSGLPNPFFTKPPDLLLLPAAQERLIKRYEQMLQTWSLVLAALAKHGADLAEGRGVKPIRGGFTIPYDWQSGLPLTCDLNVVENEDARCFVVRLLEPTPRVQAATVESFEREGWHVPDEEKRAKEALATTEPEDGS